MAQKLRKSAPKAPKRLQTLTIRLSDEMMEELRTAAADELRTISNLAVLYISRGLEAWREMRGAKAGKKNE